jgi:hypothetical protein
MERDSEGVRVKVEAELMDDPCLWRWQILDERRGEVVADSWTREWTAYESKEEAVRAGRAKLSAYRVR